MLCCIALVCVVVDLFCVGLRWVFVCVVSCPIVLSLVLWFWFALDLFMCCVVSDCVEFGYVVLRWFSHVGLSIVSCGVLRVVLCCVVVC